MLPVKHQKSWCSVFFLLVFNQIMKIMNIQYVFFFLQIFVLSEIPTILPTSFFFRTSSPTNNPGETMGVCLAAFGQESRKLRTALWRHLDPDQVSSKPPRWELGRSWVFVIFRMMGVVFFGGWESWKFIRYGIPINKYMFLKRENTHTQSSWWLSNWVAIFWGLGKHSSRLRFKF